MIDPKGIDYVYNITEVDEQSSRVILMIQTRDQKPLAITFTIDNFVLNSLIEKFEVE